MRFGIFSRGIARIPFLSALAGADIQFLRFGHKSVDAIAGWGLRPSTRKARAYAQKNSLPYVALEDGFLRSFGTGAHCPPLSMVVDKQGIYYDSTRPSELESLLNSAKDLETQYTEAAQLAHEQLLMWSLSKYNHAPALAQDVLRSDDKGRVLVVDQTVGDMSVSLGGATALSFQQMLAAALNENPEATIYVKTHPEVSSGHKGGYYSMVASDARVVLLREPANPLSLIARMDRVYVVTSTMGFEALLAGKPVTCFGTPWYAGWGATDDRNIAAEVRTRRARSRSVRELFIAAYLSYSRYLNPETRQTGDISHVMSWLELQRKISTRYGGRMICVGFRRWKAANLRPMLSLHPGKVIFVKNASAAMALSPIAEDCLVFWGRVPPAGTLELAEKNKVRLLRMEDGFVRSVGLGSDLIPPQSFVLDSKGIYFDPSQPSELEALLNTSVYSAQDIERAQHVREFIVQHGITKYNTEPLITVKWPSETKQVVLVPGQVEDDASIRFGCDPAGVCTNLGLLRAVREMFPNAFIVYKTHPDVMSGNRKGKLSFQDALEWADHVEKNASVLSCIDACDTVANMTSLTGFDALLRGKRVVVFGRPFYAGWGLTQDMLPIPRRQRQLCLDELVAGALLHYPLYWDPDLRGYTTCEAVLQQIFERREALTHSGKMQGLRLGYIRRQWRKFGVLVRALGN